MALDLAAIREALVQQIVNGVGRGLTGFAYFPDSPPLPCVGVLPGDPYVDVQTTMGSGPHVTVNLDVRVLVPSGDGISGQRVLDELLSAGTGEGSSIVDAIESDRTVNGTAATSVVTEIQDRGRVVLGDGSTSAQTASLLVSLTLRRV